MAAGIIWGIPLVTGSLSGFGWSLAGLHAAGGAPFQSFQPGGTVGQCAGGGVWNGGIGKLPREFTAGCLAGAGFGLVQSRCVVFHEHDDGDQPMGGGFTGGMAVRSLP